MAEVTINVAQAGESTSEAQVRSHKIVIDRPEAKGGADKGAMGGELLLVGLGGCFLSNLLAAIKARDVDASEININVTGTLEKSPPRFSAVHMNITGHYTDIAEIERLAGMSEKACIVSNTLKGAVNLSITVS